MNEKAIDFFVRQFGVEESFYTNKLGFMFRDDLNIICYGKVVKNSVHKRWMKYIKQTFGYKVKYPFAFYLLHEIGHSQVKSILLSVFLPLMFPSAVMNLKSSPLIEI